jgi:hypothetical protein
MPSSAPCLRAKASFSLDEATAMTRAPMSLPISTAASPAPPAAPKHRKRLAFLEVVTVLEAVQRRAVGNGNSCRGLIAYTATMLLALVTTFSRQPLPPVKASRHPELSAEG